MDAPAEHASPSNDAHDLFDYDLGLDDILQGSNTAPTADASKPAGDSNLLGLDEEVKVTKKRQPVAKLDEGRLLSQSGIPKLRQSAKKKLRFKGKGHEFSDAARLLNFYQLWLDDLFPRAKFADGLAMIEKLGHTKRIQTMRREWIDEEKRKVFETSEPSHEAPDEQDLPTRPADGKNNTTPNESAGVSSSHPNTDRSADPELFMPDPDAATRPTISHPEPEDDDLDDLLREQDEPMSGSLGLTAQRFVDIPDDFDAEYEAMREFGM